MIYTIETITTLIGARRYGTKEAQIGFLLTDSRSLCFPEETLFFALKTERNNGQNYIPDLYRRGVRNFVVETLSPIDTDKAGSARAKSWSVLYPDANFLKVVNSREALQRLAERHREEFDIPVVGITGSNGKTVTKEWLYQILSGLQDEQPADKYIVTRSPRSYNSQIGVPLSVWLLNQHTQVGIFEAGISEPDEMQALHDIIQPTIAVLTNLGAAHQKNFRSLEEKCMEKLTLFRDTEAIVYPSDNEVVSRCVRKLQFKGRKLGWSMTNDQAPMYIKKMHQDDTTTISYVFNETEGEYTIPFIDEASVQNSISCAVIALHLGIAPEVLKRRMEKLEPVAMRLEVKEGQRGCTLINDSYNSDINSLNIALDFMNRRPDQQGRSHTLILSDIEQSDLEPDDLYQEVAKQAAKRHVQKLIGIGKQQLSANKCNSLIPQQYYFPTVDAFIRSKEFRNLHDEVILLKGARRFGFDQLTEQLVQKVHETTLEVHLNAVVDNLNYYRSFLKPETKMVCMIKADAYGAGAVEIAKTLQDHRVDYLAVAVADEGVELRKAGITSNIMIMNPEMTAFKTMFDYDLEPEVYSFRLLDALVHAARQEGITGWPVHIKLDTGMHRLGFNVREDMDLLIDKLRRQQAVIPRSVFSHFVGSDSDDFDEFSAQQFALFKEGADSLQRAFEHKILRHMDNSAGIEHFPERQMDMCRLGLGLYGVNPRTNEIINNVSTLKTTILQLRHVKAGESVGYSRKTILEKDSLIGAIPIGYADGLNRHLGNRHGYCLVNGHRAAYVGNICMDVAMIDVTDIDCKEGDSVEIFGDNLPVTALSDVIDTIPYEVLTGISNRVKRIYFQD